LIECPDNTGRESYTTALIESNYFSAEECADLPADGAAGDAAGPPDVPCPDGQMKDASGTCVAAN